MKLFKRIFTGPGDVGEAVDTVGKVVDKAWFTNQERAEVDGELREWYLKYLETTQPQNLARRYIAFGIVGLWIGLIVVAVIARAISVDYSDFVFGVLTDVVAIPFAGIMAFYFGTHLLRSYRKE